MKQLFWMLLSILMILVLTACAASPAAEPMEEQAMEETAEVVVETSSEEEMAEESSDEEMMAEDSMMMLTLDELKMYNGKDDQPAYVAVEGTIYDVTGIPAWTGGEHNGNMAGNDVTDAIANAPHGKKVLEKLTVVGKISEDMSGQMMDDGMMKLTLEELKMYNGKDGQPAYVAVKGVIYDVTGIPAWTGGTHNGNMAGNDVTDAIANAPHGEKVLKKLTVVGELIE